MDIITETELLKRITAFLERHEMARTTFGRNATGEPQLIRSIENGRSPSLSVTHRVIDYMTRTDAEARTQAKLNAPLDADPGEEEEIDLPFRQAPVNPTGASSPICSSTSALPPSSVANGSSHSCFGEGELRLSAPSGADADSEPAK